MSDPRTLLITGGASGLGQALARLAGSKGWRVAVADTHQGGGEAICRELLSAGTQALFIRCDVRIDSEVRLAVQRVIRRWGQLDALINNAGNISCGQFESLTDDDWHWQLDTNLMGAVRGSRAAVSEMRRRQQGHIVNIAGISGLIPSPGTAALNATQAAIIALSETLRSELQPLGIHVSVVLPGFFRSGQLDALRSADPVMRARLIQAMNQQPSSIDELAALTLNAIDRKTFMVIPHEQKAQVRLKRWQPKKALQRMLKLAAKYRK